MHKKQEYYRPRVYSAVAKIRTTEIHKKESNELEKKMNPNHPR